MPICKRDGFENAPLKDHKNDTFHDNDEVFFCEVTKEIFRDYEDYFRHVMVINSTVWQCEATGRENLTYAEALRSERRARKKMELFKDSLRPPVMLIIEHAKQSSLKALTTIGCKFLRKRFFLNEEVTACHKSNKYQAYKVVGILPPGKGQPSATQVYEDTEKLLYKLRRTDDAKTEVTVPFDNIKRQRFEFTAENLLMFIKNNVVRVDGILGPKPESYTKYITERKISFSSIFIGKMPHFTPAKIKRPAPENGKKQSTMSKYLVKNEELSAEALAQREKERAEKAEAKEKSLKEEMERVRREKQERMAELERQKQERRALLLEKIEAECNAMLTKTDDLERTDQLLLPTYTPIETYIPKKLLGDAFMVREFIHSFASILSGVEVFRSNMSFYEMSRAFTTREVIGPLSDILLILLGTIFDLQHEEDEECTAEYWLRPQYNAEPYLTMAQAARAHFYSRRHFSFKINELPIDALTLSEVLRLHLLSSGATVSNRTDKWRVMYRNGYSSSEDPGMALRLQHPHILRSLKMYTIYHLPFVDIMRVLNCLMAQILTYSSTINLIEERMENMSKARSELRGLTISENRRLVSVQSQKKALTTEHNQQCADEAVKNDPEKKRQLEEKLNKKVAELLAQSERDHRKHQQQIEKVNCALFDFLVCLGMDRAYRKYYVLESIPGIFVEHPADCMDTCLSNPPKNALSSTAHPIANLPKNRKELRAYLLRMYTDEEKKLAQAEKSAQAGKKTVQALLENKENQQNHLVNGLAASENKEEPARVVENGQSSLEDAPPAQPTQYQLFMCTGDPRNCIVHDTRNADRKRWSYLYEEEDIDALIAALNPLGERESQLREQLTTLHALIVKHTRKCPFDQLSLDSESMSRFKNLMITDTNRKYSRFNNGLAEGTDLNEVMYSALVGRILQFESDIYTGDLGRLKVKDMAKWRKDVLDNTYDPQGKLQWGVTQKAAVAGDVEEDLEDGDEDEVNEGNGKEDTPYEKPYRDPGEGLGQTMEIDSEDSEDEGISLHDSDELRTCVKHLASALLQVEQAIERRFIKEPFGAPLKEAKEKEVERKTNNGAKNLKQWEVSLMESVSYSQVFLHLNVLHDSIMWARSTNKSNCQVCRRGSDPEKMLLCDECNGGTHMFCMKPKMKTVPEGNWYCSRCIKRLGLKNGNEKDGKQKGAQKRKRAFIVEEDDDNVSDSSSTMSSTSNQKRQTGGRRRSNKRIQSQEIETLLEEEQSATDTDGAEESDGDDEEAQDGNDKEEGAQAESNPESDSEEQEEKAEEEQDDENICSVCSYDGGDLFCVRCKDSFHLECVSLKRPPRYNFICTKCKSKDDKKRSSRGNDTSDEDDDDSEDSEPTAKRSRQSRASLRNSQVNGNDQQQQSSSSSRRSNRRTGDHLPLNSSALYDLLDDVMKHEEAWPFLRPVLQSKVKDYYKIIKTPMDFAKVKSKLNMGEYQLNEELMNDVQLVFKNCEQYNVKGNEIYEAGVVLEKYVTERCKQLNLPFKPTQLSE